jgi:hypothetical protein
MNRHSPDPAVTDDEYANYVEQCDLVSKEPLSRELYEVVIYEYEQHCQR